MDYKYILSELWRTSKVSFFLSFFSVTYLFLRGFVILPFRFIPKMIRKKLHNKASVIYNPSSEEKFDLEFYARQAIYIFSMENNTILEKAFPNYDYYHVSEAREVRFTIVRNDFNKEYNIAVRGSSNEQNWIDNFRPKFVTDKEINARIHEGYRDITLELLDKIEPLLTEKDYSINIAGASLGGVISISLGWFLDTRGYNVDQLYNFAGPKLTDADYSHLNVITVMNKLDAVPLLPLVSPLHHYRHQGQRIVIIPNKDYKDNEGSAEWRLYKDNLLSDFLLSSWGIDRKLDGDEHTSYASYILKFVGKDS